jgi:NitT/TauT family transport system substrate-binding protein
MKRRTILGGLGIAAAALPAIPVLGQASRITFGYTAVVDFASVFVAAREGLFSKRHLDVSLQPVSLNPDIPAALETDAIQIGGPTPSVYLQAVDSGLDHVVSSGGSLTDKRNTHFALVGRADSGIRAARDCVGKTIGVPGFGAFLHVTLRGWLRQKGIDHRRVNFVEAPLSRHGDLLRSGAVDAVATGDPFMSAILDSDIGHVVSYYATFLENGKPILLHTARRAWAQSHPAQTRAFRQAIEEAAVFMRQPGHEERVRKAIGSYIDLPRQTLARTQAAPPGPIVTEKQLAWWVKLMKEQDMLKTDIRVGSLIVR